MDSCNYPDKLPPAPHLQHARAAPADSGFPYFQAPHLAAAVIAGVVLSRLDATLISRHLPGGFSHGMTFRLGGGGRERCEGMRIEISYQHDMVGVMRRSEGAKE